MATTRIAFAHLLRGLAATSVIISHFGYFIWHEPKTVGTLLAYPGLPEIVRSANFVPMPDFGIPYFWGHLGVALFFLISGFVIPFSLSSASRSGFAAARIFRIWPTYLCGLAIALLCIVANARLAGTPFPYSSEQILLNALIVPRWPTLAPSIDGIIWTLEVELFFYAVCFAAPSAVRGYDRRLFLGAALVVPLAYGGPLAGGVFLRIGMPAYALLYWVSTVPVYLCFIFCGVAFYFHHQKRLGTCTLLITQSFLLLCFVTSLQLGFLATPDWAAPISYVAAYALFALCYLFRQKMAALPKWMRLPLQRLADISYPLYAVHAVLGYTILAYGLAAGLSAWAAIGLAAASALTLATAVHRIIEVPSQVFGKALAAKLLPHPLQNPTCTTAPRRESEVTAT